MVGHGDRRLTLDFYGHKLKLTYDDGKLRLKDAGHVLIFEKKK